MKIKNPSQPSRFSAHVTVGILSAVCALAAPTPTPALTEGPFYPFNASNTLPPLPAADRDNDLTRVAGSASASRGTPFLLSGVVRNLSGAPISGATVELWQTDGGGVYYHSSDRSGKRDESFQHYGESITDAGGRYSFRTLQPGLYTGRIRHFHFKVKIAGATVLTSQFIFEDERAKFKGDGDIARLTGESLEAIVLAPSAGTDGAGVSALIAPKDIVVDPNARANTPRAPGGQPSPRPKGNR